MTSKILAKSALRGTLIVLGVVALSGCIAVPSGESTCTQGGPNNPSWPYCAPSQPGGPGPADDPINPYGG